MIKKINIRQEGVESPSFTNINEQYAFAHRLAELAENASDDSVIDAQVYIPECAPSDKKKVNDKFGEVIKVDESCIQFEDLEVKKVLVSSTNPKIDVTGDGKISIAEAEYATSLPSFIDNKAIESFEELKYFKNIALGARQFSGSSIKKIDISNVDVIPFGLFHGTQIENIVFSPKVESLPDSAFSFNAWGVCSSCANLGYVDLSNITSIGRRNFYNDRSLSKVDGLDNHITYIGQEAFSHCPIEKDVLNLPYLEGELGGGAFTDAKFKKVILGDRVTSIGTGAESYNSNGTFCNCTELEVVIIGNSMSSIGKVAFSGDSKLNTFICKAYIPPTLGLMAFNGCPFLYGIYVPDASVDAYKTAEGWSAYADRFKPLSEWDGE